jgi:hypothetical protein
MTGRFAAVVALGAALTACTGAPQPTSTTSTTTPATTTAAEPAAALVTWADGMCLARRDSLWNPPPPVPATAVAPGDRPAVLTYLTQGRDHFTAVTARFAALTGAPVDGGAEVAEHMRATIGGLAERFTGYVDSATTSPAFAASYRLGLTDVASWSFGRPSMEDLADEEPMVAAAMARAANCA